MSERSGFDDQNQHWMEVRVFYEDTDFTGMVYHANYLKYFERGRSNHLRDAGVSHADLLNRPDPAAFTLLKTNVEYKNAAKIDDLLHVRTRYLGLQGPRILFDQTCLRGDEMIATGEIIAITIHADGRARRPIRDIAKMLERVIYRGEPD